ncbi:MAG: DUF89 family protein [Spirochaetaceae bacterium]|nr:DUF89 family protein [Spirochaetaceae bacterium]
MNKNEKNKPTTFFSASQLDSFAYFTIKERFPKIYNDYCSGNFDDFIEHTTVEDALKNIFKQNECSDLSFIQGKETKTLKDFFESEPFFESEVLFYHVLLAQKEYFKNKNDFFAIKKDTDYTNEHDSYRKELENLFNQGNYYQNIKDQREKFLSQQRDFRAILNYSLTANTGDLSQLEINRPDSVRILHDDTDKCFNFIISKKHKRFDIICDNSGAELFSDIYLAVFMIVHDYVNKVVLHVKSYPYFVSDATIDDFGRLVNILTKNKSNSQLLELLSKKKIEVKTHKFWTEAKYFYELPKDLGINKNTTDLLIVKGDLNYRRLVGDKNWKSTDSFEKRCLIKDIPVIAPRVLKSDVLVGVEPVFISMAKAQDKKFKTDGKWGVIQTTLKKKLKNVPKNRKIKDKKSKKENIFKSKDDKKDKKAIHTKLYFGILVLILLLIIFVIGSIVLSFFKGETFVNNDTVNNVSVNNDTVNKIDFALVLSALTVLVTGSFIMPKLILENEVKVAVNQYSQDMLEKKAKECIDGKINEVKNEIKKTDAHLSRMIAFDLVDEYPIWSIGWAFRSLKRYVKLDSKKVALVEYTDFVRFINEGIITKAKEKIIDKTENLNNTYFFDLLNDMKIEAEKSLEPSFSRPSIRAVKDIVDFEYEITLNEKSNLTEDYKEIMKPVCKNVGCLAQLLCSVLMYGVSEIKQNKTNVDKAFDKQIIPNEWLLENILGISDFGKKCATEENRIDFRNKLKTKLEVLYSNLHNNSKSMDINKKHFFFEEISETKKLIKSKEYHPCKKN